MYVSPPCVMIPLYLIPTVWDNSEITLTEGRALDFSLELSGSAARRGADLANRPLQPCQNIFNANTNIFTFSWAGGGLECSLERIPGTSDYNPHDPWSRPSFYWGFHQASTRHWRHQAATSCGEVLLLPSLSSALLHNAAVTWLHHPSRPNTSYLTETLITSSKLYKKLLFLSFKYFIYFLCISTNRLKIVFIFN